MRRGSSGREWRRRNFVLNDNEERSTPQDSSDDNSNFSWPQMSSQFSSQLMPIPPPSMLPTSFFPAFPGTKLLHSFFIRTSYFWLRLSCSYFITILASFQPWTPLNYIFKNIEPEQKYNTLFFIRTSYFWLDSVVLIFELDFDQLSTLTPLELYV